MGMSTMNVSLPDDLRIYVDNRVDSAGFGSTSEYVRALIRRDRDRQHLRDLLLEGAGSPIVSTADGAYFADLRERARQGEEAHR